MLKKREILQKNICVIGDGKANFLHGIMNLKYDILYLLISQIINKRFSYSKKFYLLKVY